MEEIKAYATEMQKLFPTDSQYDTSTLILENDNKRFIKILKEEYLNDLISEYLTRKTIGEIVIV